MFCGFDLFGLLLKMQFGDVQVCEILDQFEDVIYVVFMMDVFKFVVFDCFMEGWWLMLKFDYGYKDCFIWESVLMLFLGFEVMFVICDEIGFFENGVFVFNFVKEVVVKGLNLIVLRIIEVNGVLLVVDVLKV